MIFLVAYLAALVAMFVIDLVWLSSMMSRFYQPKMSHLLASSFSMAPAVVFYLIYVFALTYFVILPAFENRSLSQALLGGFIFGLAAYGTYDLTNQATLKNWPLELTVVDMAWGSILTTLVASISYKIVEIIYK